ncbi:hypothetical protein LINGRAHAP2_LOCUS33109 [Linum grandiflorum]
MRITNMQLCLGDLVSYVIGLAAQDRSYLQRGEFCCRFSCSYGSLCYLRDPLFDFVPCYFDKLVFL